MSQYQETLDELRGKVWASHGRYANPDPVGYTRSTAPSQAADIIELLQRQVAALQRQVAAAAAPAAMETGNIAKAKKIMNAVDDYHDKPTTATRADLRAVVLDQLVAARREGEVANRWRDALDTELVNIHLGTTETPAYNTPNAALDAMAGMG